MAEITYQLERFDGPLDLLLNLIHKNKVNIADIPIALICDQYLAYLRAAERMNMELTSDFIVMASELMLIKSKMLLPRKEPDKEDPRQELAQLLVLSAGKRRCASDDAHVCFFLRTHGQGYR